MSLKNVCSFSAALLAAAIQIPAASSADESAAPVLPEVMQLGEGVYQSTCAACHGNTGGGEGGGPPLIANFRLEDEGMVIDRILLGGGYMPGFGWVLSDTEVAAVATYIRNTWDNSHGGVTEAQVLILR